MAHYLLVLALTCFAGSLAVPFGAGLGGGFLGPVGPVIGIPHGKGGGYDNAPLKLTCAVNFTGPHGPNGGYGLVNAIAMTVEERNQGRGGYGGINSLYGGYVGGLSGLHGNAGGLSATIDIFSAYGGQVSIAFTEKARPERGCYAEDFGDFFTGERKFGGHGPGLGGLLGGLGGYGGYSGFGLDGYGIGGGLGGFGGGYGAAGGLGFGLDPFALAGGFGFGLGHGPKKGRSGGYGQDLPVRGVIAEVNLGSGSVSSINIDNLQGFKSLSDLAGRGVVVCPNDAIESDYGTARCEGGIIACCALHYDMNDQSLNIGGPAYRPPPPPQGAYPPPPPRGAYPPPPPPGPYPA